MDSGADISAAIRQGTWIEDAVPTAFCGKLLLIQLYKTKAQSNEDAAATCSLLSLRAIVVQGYRTESASRNPDLLCLAP